MLLGNSTLGVHGSYLSTQQSSIRSIERGLKIIGISLDSLCVTPVDLQIALDNQAGYLLRPMSIRVSQKRPIGDELIKLGRRPGDAVVRAASERP